MEGYLAPLLLLALLFVAFGLVHRNGKGGAGCSGCTGCEDETECRSTDTDADATRPR